MNEQIRGFSDQARQHADSYDDEGTPIWFQMYNEKFAELIVGECISCLNDGAIQAGDVRTTVGTVEKTLKQHFGVE